MKKLLLSLLSLVVCLICADLALQLRREKHDREKNMWPHPVLHHVRAPSRTTLDTYRSIPFHIQINKQGWTESYDVQKEKPEDTYRIFYVGDSTTEAVVEHEHKMVEIVERRLNEAMSGSGLRVEAINAGTSSYGCLNYYLLVKTVLLDYDPDLVVVNVDMTDVVNDCVYRKSMVTNALGEILAVRPPEEDALFQYAMGPEGVIKRTEMPRWYQWLAKHSGLLYYAERVIDRRQWRRIESHLQIDETGNWLRQEWTSETERDVEESMRVLGLTIDLLNKRGVKVLITSVPHFLQYKGTQSARPHEVVREVSVKHGVPYLDSYNGLKPLIKGSDVKTYYWSNDNTHFNIDGNAIWGELQAECILDPANRLLPDGIHDMIEPGMTP